jgi:hypothetical protein
MSDAFQSCASLVIFGAILQPTFEEKAMMAKVMQNSWPFYSSRLFFVYRDQAWTARRMDGRSFVHSSFIITACPAHEDEMDFVLSSYLRFKLWTLWVYVGVLLTYLAEASPLYIYQ